MGKKTNNNLVYLNHKDLLSLYLSDANGLIFNLRSFFALHLPALLIDLQTLSQLIIISNHTFPILQHTLPSCSTVAAVGTVPCLRAPQHKSLREEKVLFPTTYTSPSCVLDSYQSAYINTRLLVPLPTSNNPFILLLSVFSLCGSFASLCGPTAMLMCTLTPGLKRRLQ